MVFLILSILHKNHIKHCTSKPSRISMGEEIFRITARTRINDVDIFLRHTAMRQKLFVDPRKITKIFPVRSGQNKLICRLLPKRRLDRHTQILPHLITALANAGTDSGSQIRRQNTVLPTQHPDTFGRYTRDRAAPACVDGTDSYDFAVLLGFKKDRNAISGLYTENRIFSVGHIPVTALYALSDIIALAPIIFINLKYPVRVYLGQRNHASRVKSHG